jgi:hypothetical protein
MEDTIENIEMALEDSASLGDAESLRAVATILNHLAFAANARAAAIGHRLAGRIDDASGYESQAEWGLRHAKDAAKKY